MHLFLQAQTEGGIAGFLPLIAILAVMYFFFLRPQMKRQKEETKFRNVLSKGMRIVTSSGIHGKISDLDEHTLVLESENSRLRFERSAVSKELTAARYPESAKAEEKK
ncbi:MAG: preprotein translocase subunit YajC [Schleiferiaceae bacterium]|jgi:preprotein translocase subunit YajC